MKSKHRKIFLSGAGGRDRRCFGSWSFVTDGTFSAGIVGYDARHRDNRQ